MRTLVRRLAIAPLISPLIWSLVSAAPTEDEAVTLTPVIVKSELERSGLPLGFQPGSFYRKDQTEISSALSRSLRDVASEIPGVSFLGGPRTRAQLPQIRGLGADRVLILEDGTRQNFQSGHSGRIFADIGGFEELEVVKGPLSSSFGSGALGGVINLRRPTARDLARRSGRNRGGEITIDTGTVDSSFGDRFTFFGVFENDDASNSIDPIVSYSESQASDIELARGSKLPYSANKTREIYGGLNAKLGAFSSGIKITNYEDDGRAPLNPAQETTTTTEIADTKNIKTDVVLSLGYEGENSAINIKPFVRNSRVERKRITDGRPDRLAVETLGVDGRYDFTTALASRGRTVLGLEVFRDKNQGDRNGTTYGLFPNGETEQMGVYVQQPIDLGSSVSAVAGLRADRYRSTPSDTTLRGNEGSAFSPKLYLTWETLKEETSENSVFIGWGRGFNAPRLQDLYVSGLHFPGQPPFAPNNFFQANPDLKPETADTFETGTRGRASSWTYSLVGFLTEASDFILRDVNIQAGTTRFANIDRATLYGGELQIGTSLDRWTFDLGASVVRAINRRADEPVSDTPADRLRLVVANNIADEWWLSLDSEIVLGQERVPNGVSATGGYTLFGAGTSWSPSKDWTLSAKLTNLLDRAYHRHGSLVDDAGRDIRVALTARF